MPLKSLKELKIFDGDIPSRPGEKSVPRDYLLKADTTPYLSYLVLKNYFGVPEFDEDFDKTQWEWSFEYDDFCINIYDWKLYEVSISIYHKDANVKKNEELAKKINLLLIKDAKLLKEKVKKSIKESKQKLLGNPFITYYSTAENLIELLEFIDKLVIYKYKNHNKTGNELVFSTDVDLWEKKSDINRSSFIMFFSSFEGFLNILYELYLKPGLRSTRLYEKISREQIDIKIRLLPVYCEGFNVETINHEDERFKNFMRIVNLRNDFVHANFVKSLERYVVKEDEFTFILENEKNTNIPTNINELDIEHVILAKSYVDNLIELIFESMELKTRKEFKRIIYLKEIEVEDEEGILIPL